MKNSTKKSKFPLAGLLSSQFTGAFNDNAWKLMIFTLATRSLNGEGISQADFEYESQMKATLALMVFLVPMLLFSIPAGGFSDKKSKRFILISMKGLETVFLGLATLSLFLAPSHLLIPYIILGLMGMQSAFFSPAKYGILPQLLPYEKLSRGNGLVEMFTMLAIITGTGLGTIFLSADHGGTKPHMTWTGPFFLFLISFGGLVASFFVPKVSAARAEAPSMIKTIKEACFSIYKDRILLLAIIGNILFWSIISLLGQNVLVYAKGLVKDFEKGELFQGLLPASFGLGIAFGAFFGGKLSGDRIEYGLIPFGSIGFALMSMALGVLTPGITGTILILTLMGLSAGMLMIPLKAIVQWRSPDEQRGSVISLGNAFDIFGMIIGSFIAAGMTYIGTNLEKTLVLSSCIVVLATFWSVRLLPEALTRLFFIILTNSFYKIRIIGKENIPKEGSALLVSNHLSAIDAFFVMASVDRPVRFIMNETYYNKWWFKPFALAMDAIPVPYSNKEEFHKKLRLASKYLKRGEVVCIFPEGQVSRTGMMQPFREGVEGIIKGRSSPVIPINIDHVWGTLFSPKGGKYIPRRPQSIPHPMTVSIGKPLSSDTSFNVIRNEIRKLGCHSWLERKADEIPIHYHFIKNVWRAPWKLAIADKEHKKVSRLKVLTSAILLSRLLKNEWKNEEIVGLLFPPSIYGVIANLATTLTGRAVININYQSKMYDPLYFIKDSKVKMILTSREFFEKNQFNFDDSIKILFIEEINHKITSTKKFTSMLLGLIAPQFFLERVCGYIKKINVDDLLTIIYTSRTSENSKGVMLTHFNVSSNVEAVSRVVPSTTKKDKLLHSLPFSHSFGYLTMWIGLNHGIPLIMHPYSDEVLEIAELIKNKKITMLWTFPSFLNSFIQEVPPEMLGALRFVLTGGEKLKEEIADDFKNKFGITPVESYGTTECSSIISTSTLDVRLPGVFQVGSIKGSVGQPLPGVRVKVVDPETFDELPPGEIGLLLTKGPNIMKGYLGWKELSHQRKIDGWYITPDRAKIDENDYIYIQDE